MQRLQPPQLVRHRARDLSPEQVHAVCALIDRVWPDPDSTFEHLVEWFRTDSVKQERDLFVVWDEGVPVANAMVFARGIATESGPLRVMALAAVCCDPGRRGEGWGRVVTRAAFGEVDRGAFPVSLFQTGIPRFYARLGAREVHNRFINSRHEPGVRGSADQPWWNPHVMIYPAAHAWPSGTVDLLGPGY